MSLTVATAVALTGELLTTSNTVGSVQNATTAIPMLPELHTYPGRYHTVEGRIPCGRLSCDPDYSVCCQYADGTHHCCSNNDRARKSPRNSYKWVTWLGSGIGIGLAVFIAFLLLRRYKQSQYIKHSTAPRARFAPAEGMACNRRTPPLDTFVSIDLHDGGSSGGESPSTPGGGGMTPVSRGARPPPYNPDDTIRITTNSSAIMTEEHERHFAAVAARPQLAERRLPNYTDLPQQQLETLPPSRLLFMSQSSQDQLLPPSGGDGRDYELSTPPTPPPGDSVQLLEPPPAYAD